MRRFALARLLRRARLRRTRLVRLRALSGIRRRRRSRPSVQIVAFEEMGGFPDDVLILRIAKRVWAESGVVRNAHRVYPRDVYVALENNGGRAYAVGAIGGKEIVGYRGLVYGLVMLIFG